VGASLLAMAAAQSPQASSDGLTQPGSNTCALVLKSIVTSAADNLAEQVKAVFPAGAQVIFDTTGFWLQEAVSALANFGRIAIIAAPPDGMVHFPALALYRKGGVLIGVNSLLYDNTDCARRLEEFGRHFEAGVIDAPTDILEIPLADGKAQYALIAHGSSTKAVLVP